MKTEKEIRSALLTLMSFAGTMPSEQQAGATQAQMLCEIACQLAALNHSLQHVEHICATLGKIEEHLEKFCDVEDDKPIVH